MSEVDHSKTVVLLGKAAVGKSTIGGHLRDLMGFRVVDMDIELIKQTSFENLFSLRKKFGVTEVDHLLAKTFVDKFDLWAGSVVCAHNLLYRYEQAWVKLSQAGLVIRLVEMDSTTLKRYKAREQRYQPDLATLSPRAMADAVRIAVNRTAEDGVMIDRWMFHDPDLNVCDIYLSESLTVDVRQVAEKVHAFLGTDMPQIYAG